MISSFPNDTYRGLADSHVHTQSMLHRGMDVFSIYDRLFSCGFAGGIDIGCTHDDLPERTEILKSYDRILLAGAMGPWEAGRSEVRDTDTEAEFSGTKSMQQLQTELGILRRNLENCPVRFIGEIGLDYYWEYGNREKQHLLFETQMKWADEMGLCVLIHDRDADSDVVDVIRHLGPGKGGVIHCFDGSPAVLETALDNGYYISFAGNLTYRNNERLRQMLRRVPSDRLLLETDAPYLTPVPLRGQPNTPEYIIHTYECAAEVLGLSLENMKQTVLENFNGLCSR